ncbi:MAG: formylglycine-generating enzyme family protein, partial [Bacteroidales bacterium]
LASSLVAPFYFSGTNQGGGSSPSPTPTVVSPVKPQPVDLPDFVSMVYVQGGSFNMGDEFGEGSSDEQPVHTVSLSSYWLGATEVTQAQWVEIMGNNPSHFSGCSNCPVEQVSYEDIQEFLRKLNQKYPNKNYRLPTEAEWEYAAREGGKKVRFGNGKNHLDASEASFDATGDYSYSNKGTYRQKTTPVKSFSANALGLYDMAGNVWEWCSDWYGDYSSSSQSNPTGASSGSARVCRGGSWRPGSSRARAAYRHSSSPSDRDYALGFRLCR